MNNLRQKHSDVSDENSSLKAEVQKGVEEIATVVGQWYFHCLDRMSKAGFSIDGHSFEDFIRDHAASRSAGNDGPSNAGDA